MVNIIQQVAWWTRSAIGSIQIASNAWELAKLASWGYCFQTGLEHSFWTVLQTFIIQQENEIGGGCVTRVAICRRAFITTLAREHAVEVNLHSCDLLVDIITIISDCFYLESFGDDIGQGVLQLLQNNPDLLRSNILLGDCIGNQDGVVIAKYLACKLGTIGTFQSPACDIRRYYNLWGSCDQNLEVLLIIVWRK